MVRSSYVALFVIVLAQNYGIRPYAPQGMPGQVPLNQIVPQMGNPWPLGSAGNPVVSGPPRPWGSMVPIQPSGNPYGVGGTGRFGTGGSE